jgi:NADH-quinone oxidoreductase subunit D
LRGETIVSVEPPQTGYCRRGVAALIEGKSVDDALTLIEHSCSFAGTAHRIALCQALESAMDASPSRSARVTRILFAEVERILARIWTLALAARAVGLTPRWRTALRQREDLFEALEAATGKRVFWGVAMPGGVRGDIEIDPLRSALEELDPAVTSWRVAAGPQGPLGRAGKGVASLTEERARELGLQGVAAGGSYASADLRQTDNDSGYADLDIEWSSLDGKRSGDVAARLTCAVEDIATSLAIAKSCLNELPAGASDETKPLNLPDAARVVSASVEGPHGPVTLTATYSTASTLSDVRIETAATAALEALPSILEGRHISQALLILASLDLCLECLDE